MELAIGVGIWIAIFLVWYYRTYPEKVKQFLGTNKIKLKMPVRKKPPRPVPNATPRARPGSKKDFKVLVESVESICAQDRFTASEAATLVEAVMALMEIEPASGQIWEAYALDSLERAKIICDGCGKEVEKTVRKTGVKIECLKCQKWLALKNSKVTVIDPTRADMEDWEM